MKTSTLFTALGLALGSLVLSAGEQEQARQVTLSRDQVENTVKRSYQYVAMYNVLNKTWKPSEIELVK